MVTSFNKSLNAFGLTYRIPSTIRAAGSKDSDVSRLMICNLPLRTTCLESGCTANVAIFISINAVFVGASQDTL